jgi:hypothetical protein
MPMVPVKVKSIYLVGGARPGRQGGDRFTHLRGRRAIHDAVWKYERPGTWVTSDPSGADRLVEEVAERVLSLGSRRRRFGDLVLLEPPRIESLAAAQDLFTSVAWSDARKSWLPLPDLIEALGASDPSQLIIGGLADPGTMTLTVYRGDLERLTVPFSVFRPSGDGTAPDFSDFAVIDNGHAIRLGRYESAADAILYEGDPAYRKRLRDQRIAAEQTFGASLRRLRLQRRLRQDDFAPLSPRTIARIENGATPKPHGRTLKLIAQRLDVEPDAIETF